MVSSSVCTNNVTTMKRGAFILLEGVDRCGKTTQSKLLLDQLNNNNIPAVPMRFPDRTTSTGHIINQYLQDTTIQLDDHAIHLLFSANRWESASTLIKHIQSGTSIVCDRYAYSGVAFSSAKVHNDNNNNNKPILDLDWCQAPDKGLPAPDCVIFLDISQDEAERRGGYGGERYEKRDMQIRVRDRFMELQQLDEKKVPWKIVNAAQTIEQVQADIWKVVMEIIDKITNGDQIIPVQKLWQDGEYDITTHNNIQIGEKEN